MTYKDEILTDVLTDIAMTWQDHKQLEEEEQRQQEEEEEARVL